MTKDAPPPAGGLFHLLFLLSVISYLYLAVHIIGYYQLAGGLGYDMEEKGEAIKRIVLVNLLTFLIMISLFFASTTPHAPVPRVWPWINDGEAGEDTSLMERSCVEVKKDGSRRYCRVQQCRTYKPDRTHHCSKCVQCIQEFLINVGFKMDHHCPWIRNCVGFNNRKYFFCLVFYSFFALLVISVSLAPAMEKSLQRANKSPLDVFILFTWFFDFFFLVFLICPFFLFHCWLIANAYTTLEFCEKRSRDGKKDYMVSPFDCGLYRNICHVLGPYFILWLLPTRLGMCKCKEVSECDCGTRVEYNSSHPLTKHFFHFPVEKNTKV